MRKSALISTLLLLALICACEKKPAETPIDMETLTAGMVLIPAGEFMMGSPPGEGEADEHPQHRVYVDAFYMDKYEVTNGQYKKYCDATEWPYPQLPEFDDDYFLGKPDSPVMNVSWEDAMAYAEWAGKRLSTEAEWEYACRAGSTTKYCFGDDESQLGEYAWYEANSGGTPHPVGQKKPNAWGLYDMHGNAMEWCMDWYDPEYYSYSPSQNPTGPPRSLTGPDSFWGFVIRGGQWNSHGDQVRSAARSRHYPPDVGGFGFRCALDDE